MKTRSNEQIREAEYLQWYRNAGIKKKEDNQRGIQSKPLLT